MHILYVCSEYPYLDVPSGGFGTYVKNISVALLKHGHSITIVCLGKKNQKITQGKLVVVVLKDNRLTLGKSIYERLKSFLIYPFGYSWNVRNVICEIDKQKHIDIIEGGDFGAELFFYLLLKPKMQAVDVIKLHTPAFVIRKFNQEPLKIFYIVLEFLEKFCLKRVFALSSPTKTLSILVKEKIGRQIDKVIPYTISNISSFRSKKEKIVIYAGKIQPKKGVFDLLQAIPQVLNQLPKIKFFFIGPDTLYEGVSVRNLLQLKAKQLGVQTQVKFLRAVPASGLKVYYQKATICIVPSHWDNFPNVILEAGLSGCAVIATNSGGIPEIIKHNQTGLLVPVQNSNEIAKSIVNLMQHSTKRQLFVKRFYKHITNSYNAEFISRVTEDFYSRLVKEKRQATENL